MIPLTFLRPLPVEILKNVIHSIFQGPRTKVLQVHWRRYGFIKFIDENCRIAQRRAMAWKMARQRYSCSDFSYTRSDAANKS